MTLIEIEVDRQLAVVLFEPNGKVCENPVTGGRFVKGEDSEDSIAHQKHAAQRALLAREWFGLYGPKDAPALPLSQSDWEDMRHSTGLEVLVGFYARSLSFRNWEVHEHPSFDTFARGLMAMAIERGLRGLENNKKLKKRFPPCPLTGMTLGAYWAPSE